MGWSTFSPTVRPTFLFNQVSGLKNRDRKIVWWSVRNPPVDKGNTRKNLCPVLEVILLEWNFLLGLFLMYGRQYMNNKES